MIVTSGDRRRHLTTLVIVVASATICILIDLYRTSLNIAGVRNIGIEMRLDIMMPLIPVCFITMLVEAINKKRLSGPGPFVYCHAGVSILAITLSYGLTTSAMVRYGGASPLLLVLALAAPIVVIVLFRIMYFRSLA